MQRRIYIEDDGMDQSDISDSFRSVSSEESDLLGLTEVCSASAEFSGCASFMRRTGEGTESG